MPTRQEDDLSGSSTLLRLAVARPVTVGVGVILVVLFGGLTVIGLPIQVTPDVSIPTLTISTRWPGAAPTEVETEILEEQEEALKNLQGLVKMESQAGPGEGTLTLELEVGAEIDTALARVTNKLNQVPSYPDAAEEPVVSTSRTTGPPLAVITITSPDGESPARYRTWVDETIVPQIERIPGVSEARLIGGRDTVVHVDFDAAELAARKLTIPYLAERVRAELRDISGGDVDLGKRRLLLRIPVAPDDPAELAKLVLGAGPEGAPILLGDVARVALGLREAEGVAMSDDRPSMVLLLRRESGFNVLEVTRDIRARVAELQRTHFAPEGLQIAVVSDQTDYITGALELVEQNLLLGAFFAIIVLLIFLRSIGASAIISIAIPVCVFGTALGMTLFGRSVNVVSLAGVAFAIGMVLDNSIVSLERIDAHRAGAENPAVAAVRGVREIWGALLASTLTTAAVFVPIITWEGEVGQLLRDVAIAISVAMGFSLAASVIVIPSMAGRVFSWRERWRARGERGAGGRSTGPSANEPGAPQATLRRSRRALGWAIALGAAFRGMVREQVAWLTARWYRAAVVAVLAIGSAAALGLALLPPLEYLPSGDRNLVFGIIVPPPGYAIDELETMGRQVQGEIAAHTGVAKGGVPNIRRSFFVGSPERLFSGAIANDPEEIGGVLTFLRRIQSKIPGVFAFTTQASLFGSTIAGTRSIELEISGSDLTILSRIGGDLLGRIKALMPEAQIRPIPALDAGAPELRVYPRRDEVAALGLSGADLGLVVDALVDGAIVGEYGPEGRPKVDVVVRARNRSGGQITDAAGLASAPVATPGGGTVPLATLAEVREELGPTVVRRVERERTITLQVSPREDISLDRAIRQIREEIIAPLEESGTIAAGVSLRLAGTVDKLERASERFLWVLILAVVILYLVMAAVFEDFLAPLAVLVTVPLAAAGGVLGLRVIDATFGGQPLDLMTAVGFVILIGVVVNNAILVVDGSLARLRQGRALVEAVPDAVGERVRPIFMTAATSLAGLAPMVLSSGFGSELYRGVGAIVLGGLAVGTLLTVWVVPCVFSLLHRGRVGVGGEPTDAGR